MVKPLYLFDSTIIEEPLKKTPKQQLLSKIYEKSSESVISCISWEEMLYKIHSLPDSRLKDAAIDYMFESVHPNFQIIPYDFRNAQICAELKCSIKKDNMFVSHYDIENAAIAISQNLILITQNPEPYEIIADYSTLMFEKW